MFLLRLLVAVGAALCLARAQDAWTPVPQDVSPANLWSIAFGDRTLVAVGEQGTILSYNYDDRVWIRRESGTTAWLVGAGYGQNRFVVVGDRGIILTSDDSGETWIPRVSGTDTRLNAVVSGGGRWVIAGEQGTVLSSIDAALWTLQPPLGSGFLRALAYGQGQFLVGGARGMLFSSRDGLTFTPVSISTTADIEAAGISPTRFWIAGSEGLRASSTDLRTWTFAPTGSDGRTFRGLAVRNAEEASFVGDHAADAYRPWPGSPWRGSFGFPNFLATAATTGINEVLAVGFGGAIARASISASAFIVRDDGRNATHGSDVRFRVLTGETPLSYQWLREGAPIPGATHAELILHNVTAADAGGYGLQITQSTGTSTIHSGQNLYVVPGGRPEIRDSNFNPALPAAPTVVVPQPDGKILVAGPFSVSPAGGPTYGIARLNHDGSLDMDFRAGAGIPLISAVGGIHLAPDGRIYVRGSFTSIAGQPRPGLARLHPNGNLDTRFAPPSEAAGIRGAAVDSAGRLYLELASPAAVVRLADDGSIDAGFRRLEDHRLIGVDANGRVLAAERRDWPLNAMLRRYREDGTPDPSYTPVAVSLQWPVESLAVTRLVGNTLYATSAGYGRFGPILTWQRFLPDGGYDQSYVSPPRNDYPNMHGFAHAYRADGGLWQVRSSDSGMTYHATAYTATGLPDPTRYGTLPDLGDYQVLAVGPDEALYVAGYRYFGQSNRLIRLRPISGRRGRLTNLSVRTFVADGEPVIAGFVTSGNEPTRALVRAVGPGLQSFGVDATLADPQLILTRDGAAVAVNDDWSDSLAARFTELGAFALSTASKDAALESGVAAGNYTAVVNPPADQSGTVLLELYESLNAASASTRRFVNVSARGSVASGRPLIVGFGITGEVPVRVLVRGAGPALSAFGVPGVLPNPRLTLFRGETPLWENDNADSDANAAAIAFGAFPFTNGSNDSALLVTLAPGSYTAVLTGHDSNPAGAALIEVYEVR